MHNHDHLGHLIMDTEAIGWAVFLSISWFSFIMSWHCAAMCGPLICARFSQLNAGRKKVWHMTLSYNLGRLLSYTALGFMIGLTTERLQIEITNYLPGVGLSLSFMFALLLCMQGLKLVRGQKLDSGPIWLTKFSTYISSMTSKVGSQTFRSFLFGVVTVFLPCMTLSAAVAAAAMVGNPSDSALVLLGFSLGTVPVMIITPAASSSLIQFASDGKIGGFSKQRLQRIAGILLMTAGGLTALRAFH